LLQRNDEAFGARPKVGAGKGKNALLTVRGKTLKSIKKHLAMTGEPRILRLRRGWRVLTIKCKNRRVKHGLAVLFVVEQATVQ
jgi:hypothetical protein